MAARVLIADDEPNIVLALEFLMAAERYEVRTVADGEEALAQARAFRPDLILLDVMMPRRSGYEVCRAIREDPALSGIRVVLLTAKGRDADAEKGLALGADAYVTKPFATRALVETVRALLGTPA